MIVVRYADDTVLGFPYEEQARNYLEQLHLQLGQYGLSINVKKTRLIEFGRKTMEKKIRGKIKEVSEALRKRMNRPIWETAQWLKSIVQGHINYFAVPGNSAALSKFRDEVVKRWLKVLRRRSQRHRMPWSKFVRLVN
jgi:RNA-directed DNA polymerase